MGLNWNEIKSRELLFSKTWANAFIKGSNKHGTAIDAAYQPSGGKKTYASDAERVAFLFELYQRITSFLPAPNAKKTRKSKVTET
jgi:hypothetical protein